MNDFQINDLIKSVNEVKDNIWLRDYQAAKTIVDKRLEKLQTSSELNEIKDSIEEVRLQTYKLRKKARAIKLKEGLDNRHWILSQLSRLMKEKEIDPLKMTYGMSFIELEGLQGYINDLLETKDEEIFLRKLDNNKYTIEQTLNGWDIRVLLKNKFIIDLEKLEKLLKEYNVLLDYAKSEKSQILELYGNEMYAKIVGIQNSFQIILMVPQSKENHEIPISLTENIIQSLSK